MALKRGLDPFEDDSLKFSWVWDLNDDDTNDSEQTGNTLGSTDDVVLDNAPHSQKSINVNSSVSSQLQHGFTAGSAFTANVWLRLNDLDEINLITIGTLFGDNSVGIGYYDGHIVGTFGSSYYNFGDEDDVDYHFFSLTYDGATVEWFQDGSSLYSDEVNINTDDTEKLGLYQNDADVYTSDFTVFSRVLTQEERDDLQNDNFAGEDDNIAQPMVIGMSIFAPIATLNWTPLKRLADPFQDNSSEYIWTFTDNEDGSVTNISKTENNTLGTE